MRDSALTDEFYDIVTDYERRMQEAEKNSRLPEKPDFAKIEAFVEEINRRVVEGNIE